MSNKHNHNNQIKQSKNKEMRNIKPLLIVVSTSLDGGEGGGGMTPTGGLGPPPPFS